MQPDLDMVLHYICVAFTPLVPLCYNPLLKTPGLAEWKNNSLNVLSLNVPHTPAQQPNIATNSLNHDQQQGPLSASRPHGHWCLSKVGGGSCLLQWQWRRPWLKCLTLAIPFLVAWPKNVRNNKKNWPATKAGTSLEQAVVRIGQTIWCFMPHPHLS